MALYEAKQHMTYGEQMPPWKHHFNWCNNTCSKKGKGILRQPRVPVYNVRSKGKDNHHSSKGELNAPYK
eukprot:1157770-Pelagomonas_calceolata.AAC.5